MKRTTHMCYLWSNNFSEFQSRLFIFSILFSVHNKFGFTKNYRKNVGALRQTPAKFGKYASLVRAIFPTNMKYKRKIINYFVHEHDHIDFRNIHLAVAVTKTLRFSLIQLLYISVDTFITSLTHTHINKPFFT